MKTESASVDHFAGLQAIADTITRLREDRAELLTALKGMASLYDGVRDVLVSKTVIAKLAAADAAIKQSEREQ